MHTATLVATGSRQVSHHACQQHADAVSALSSCYRSTLKFAKVGCALLTSYGYSKQKTIVTDMYLTCLLIECAESKECINLKHHFEHCSERVQAGKGHKGEDCVEELCEELFCFSCLCNDVMHC